MAIRPDEAPLDSDDELTPERPASWKQRVLRRVVWNGVLLVLFFGTLWVVSAARG